MSKRLVPEGGAEQEAHVPVLLAEILHALSPLNGAVILDGTFGAGGYSRALLENGAQVIGVDRDPSVGPFADRLRLDFPNRFTFLQGTFSGLDSLGVGRGVEGVVLDIGVSSMQLDQPERGFSFLRDGPLDMRMSQEGPSAADLVNGLEEEELANLLYAYGEERKSRRIARRLVAARALGPITSTAGLARLIEEAIGRKPGEAHPATRSFQALRIAVNGELDELVGGLFAAERLLPETGRLAVVTFHSLEDRIVKHFMQRESAVCMLPPRTFAEACPHLVDRGAGPRSCIYLHHRDCDYAPRLRLVVSKPVSASDVELASNPRSRSAKLGVA